MPDPTPPPSARLWHAAAALAARLHQGQFRKDGRTPYAAHAFRVAMTVRDVFGCDDPAALAAALLHDAIEDTPADFDEIVEALEPAGGRQAAEQVARIVAALTKDMRLPEDEREPAYDDGLEHADWRARLVKLADVFDNLLDSSHAGADLGKTLAKADRALLLAEKDGADHPETHRALVRLRRLMDEMRTMPPGPKKR